MNYQETINQLGGFGRLKAFVGACNFVSDGNNLTFKFKGSTVATHLSITLNSLDTYDLKFIKVRGTEAKTTKELRGIYGDQLVQIFEETTGLYLSF